MDNFPLALGAIVQGGLSCSRGPPRKIASWLGLGFGLCLGLEMGLRGGNFLVTGTIDLEPYSEPCQMPKMEFFTKIVSDSKPLTIFAKNSTLDVSQGSEYVSDINITM